MCGRYHIDTEEDIIEIREIIAEVNRKHSGTAQHAEMKTGEIFPTNIVPVAAESGVELMRWGFPMQGTSGTVINAKAETVFERPMFRTAVASRRVVIPTTGFYEWTHEGKKSKDKFLFRLPDQRVLYLAGIYTEFNLPGGKGTRFTIITTEANESVASYHSRMPICIGSDERDTWIRDNRFTEEALRREQPPLHAIKTCPIEQTQMSL